MKNYKIDFAKNMITVSAAFMKKAEQLGTKEFETMMELKKLGMIIAYQQPKPRKKPLYQLTYKRMEQFIRCSDDAEALLAEFEAMKKEGRGTNAAYLHVQQWFEEQSPNYPKRGPKLEVVDSDNNEKKSA